MNINKDGKTDQHTQVDKVLLKNEFEKYAATRLKIVNDLKEQIEIILAEIEDSTPVVSGRNKNFKSYYSKYLRFLNAGIKNPVITDIMGARIICPFIEDCTAAEELIGKFFTITEIERKEHKYKEFGYESVHILIKIPESVIKKYGNPGTDVFEIQIRTILQDAWAEVEHELVYKVEYSPFDEHIIRKLSAINANLYLADIIFQEIRREQRKYSEEIKQRRESFYHKIEDSTDAFLFSQEKNNKKTQSQDLIYNNITTPPPADEPEKGNKSIDDLLVEALAAHNQNRFTEAINLYSNILDLNPDNNVIRSIIYKHRGMANFACSSYDKAIEDFDFSLEIDPQSYKAAYYRGVVNLVQKNHLKAIDDFNLSLSIKQFQPFSLFRRGQAYFHIGDFTSALSDCENAIALEPENDSFIKFRDILHEKLKM